MRVYINRSQVHVRAAIRDCLDLIRGTRWKASAPIDEPGMTTFTLSDDWGDLGSIKVFETQPSITTFTDKPPSHVPIQEVLELIIDGKIVVDSLEMAAIVPFIEVEARKRDMGIDVSDEEGLLLFIRENPGDLIPSITKGELEAAEGVFKRLSDKIETRRRDKHEWILKIVLGDLRAQGVWIEMKRGKQPPAVMQKEPANSVNWGTGKPGRPHWPEDLWAFEQLKSGRDPSEVKKEWLPKTSEAGRDLADPEKQFRTIKGWLKKGEL